MGTFNSVACELNACLRTQCSRKDETELIIVCPGFSFVQLLVAP